MGGARPIFRNDQWQVTNSGIVSRSSGAPYRYHIDAERLLDELDSFDEGHLYGWPLYVVQMPWVNADMFFEAFKAAIDALDGQYAGKVDPARLQASFDEATHLIQHQRRPHLVRNPARLS